MPLSTIAISSGLCRETRRRNELTPTTPFGQNVLPVLRCRDRLKMAVVLGFPGVFRWQLPRQISARNLALVNTAKRGVCGLCLENQKSRRKKVIRVNDVSGAV